MSKTILVTGATGAQGGGVARHLLKDGTFSVRCLTRNPDSDKANALRSAGAEVVQGDLGEPTTLGPALSDCYGCFGVTNFWEHFAGEEAHGRNLVDAVAASNVEHFVFSTLPSAKKISGGALNVPHFDIKADLEEYCRSKGIPSTFTHVAFYYENFLYFLPPQKQEDGSYAFGVPQGDTPLAGVAVEDVGGVVTPIFKDRDRFLGKVQGVVGDDLTGAQYAQILSRVTDKKVVYNHIPREVYAGFGFPGAEELADMFEFNRLFIPSRRDEMEECRRMYSQMQDFATWAGHNRAALLAILQ